MIEQKYLRATTYSFGFEDSSHFETSAGAPHPASENGPDTSRELTR